MVIADRRIGLGDVTIPAGSSGAVSFAPMTFNDLGANAAAIQGTSYGIQLIFNARTFEGTRIEGRALRVLNVETCTTGSGGP